MRHILLAVVLLGVAAGIASIQAHAQLAIGPDGLRLGESVDRHHRSHMRHRHFDKQHELNSMDRQNEFNPQSPPIIHHYNDDEDEE
jgi:hypothetical protein